MCEIFFLKHNKRYAHFAKPDLQSARDMNSDGAGYVILQHDPKIKRWEVIDMATFESKPTTYRSNYYGYGYNQYDYDYGLGYKHYDDKPKALPAPKKSYIYKAKGDIGDYEISEDEGLEVLQEFVKEFGAQQGAEMFDEWYEKIECLEETTPEEQEEERRYEADKKDKAIDAIFNKQFQLKPRQIMITHFRLATSGRTAENTQPILEGDYMVIHNGIFAYKSEPKGMSDTRYFTHKLHSEAKKEKKMTEKKELLLIEKLLKDAGGSYSVFIYSFKTGQLYYYKSDYASFYYNNNGVTGCTKEYKLPKMSYAAANKEVVRL